LGCVGLALPHALTRECGTTVHVCHHCFSTGSVHMKAALYSAHPWAAMALHYLFMYTITAFSTGSVTMKAALYSAHPWAALALHWRTHVRGSGSVGDEAAASGTPNAGVPPLLSASSADHAAGASLQEGGAEGANKRKGETKASKAKKGDTALANLDALLQVCGVVGVGIGGGV